MPHLAQTWTVEFENYRVGKTIVSGMIRRSKREARVYLKMTGDPLQVTLSPAFAAGASPITTEVNGKRADAKLEPSLADAHVTVQVGPVQALDVLIQVNEGAQMLPVLTTPLAGDAAPAHR